MRKLLSRPENSLYHFLVYKILLAGTAKQITFMKPYVQYMHLTGDRLILRNKERQLVTLKAEGMGSLYDSIAFG